MEKYAITRRDFLMLSVMGGCVLTLFSLSRPAVAADSVIISNDRRSSSFAGSQLRSEDINIMSDDKDQWAFCGDYDKHYPVGTSQGVGRLITTTVPCTTVSDGGRTDIANVLGVVGSGGAINGHSYGYADRYSIGQFAVWMLVGNIDIDSMRFLSARDRGLALNEFGDPPNQALFDQMCADAQWLARWARSAGDIGYRCTLAMPVDSSLQPLWIVGAAKGYGRLRKGTAKTW